VAQGGMRGAVDGSQVLDLRPLHTCGGEPGATISLACRSDGGSMDG
jgi:hypothetical protein